MRSLDANHLATALTFVEHVEQLGPVAVLTYGGRSEANLEPLGLGASAA